MSSSKNKSSLMKSKNQEKEILPLNQLLKELESKDQRKNQSRLCVLCQKNSHKFQQNYLNQNLSHKWEKNINTRRKRKNEKDKDNDKDKDKEAILRRMRLLRVMNKNHKRKERTMMTTTCLKTIWLDSKITKLVILYKPY